MKAIQILRRMFPTAAAIAELHAIAKHQQERIDYLMDWINHLLDFQGQLQKRIQRLEDLSKTEQGLGPK
jgi:hypothetical protein